MRSRTFLAFGLLALLLAPPAAADPGSVMRALAANDPALGQPLRNIDVPLGFLDGNGNFIADTAEEAVYLDLDASTDVSLGDLRLAPFDTYAAGTFVALTNRDIGRKYVPSPGWLGSAEELWFADMDGTATVTEVDIRLDSAFGQRVGPGGALLGHALKRPDDTYGDQAVSVVDSDGDLRFDVGEDLYLDLDADVPARAAKVTVGDVRILPLGAAPDGAPTRAQFDALADATGVKASDEGFTAAKGVGDGAIIGLYVLGVANLLGLAYVYTLTRRGGAPKNRFK